MSIEHSPGKLAYPVREFCHAIGFGMSKFYGLVRDGEIKVVKCGKRTLVTVEEAQRFVASLSEAA